MGARCCSTAFVLGIAALFFIPACRADSFFASISGECIASPPGSSLSLTSTVAPASVGVGGLCPPFSRLIDFYSTDSASAFSSLGLLEVAGSGQDQGNPSSVSAIASYSDEALVTGPESGPGTLFLSFATSFAVGVSDGVVSAQFGGFSLGCGDFPPCPFEESPTVVFALDFTYGTPFEYTISLSASGMAEEDFDFNDSASLTSAETGNPMDTVSLGVPEPASFALIVVGLAALAIMRRRDVAESLKGLAMGKKNT